VELNHYQNKTLRDLADYLKAVEATGNYAAAYRQHWLDRDVKIGSFADCMPSYRDALKGTPHVCFKVPTGGGKTFLACAAVKVILDAMPQGKSRVVVWLVPSTAILEQTLLNLGDTRHPYRQRLDRDFSGRVALYTKEQLLSGQNFSPATVREQLSVCVLSYDSIRSKKKDGRKLYQENSQLAGFARAFPTSKTPVEGVDETALIQVLNQLAPVVIVDESHNAQSDLSVEMLKNLNPTFVLDLTATPRENSNIISYVDARELKKEHMVKLPVVVYNRKSQNDVLLNAIQLRGRLEAEAQAACASGENYIRPIVLFQAQSKGAEDAATFEKLKEKLIGIGIPKEEIAIKTSGINELPKDLLDEKCAIRYIITVNALKEGWDCPFAYILATLANRSSRVEVEQIVGRVLRQPYARKHAAAPLNLSYVLTCSDTFFETLDNIVAGLNRAGFSKKDMRIGAEESPDLLMPPLSVSVPLTLEERDAVRDIDFDEARKDLARQAEQAERGITSLAVAEMTRLAMEQGAAYEAEVAQSEASGLPGGILEGKMNQFYMRPAYQVEAEALRLPQFFLKTTPKMFHDGHDVPLNKENLSAGFCLTHEDIKISFDLSEENLYAIDIATSGEAVPNYKKMNQGEREYISKLMASSPPEQKKKKLSDILSNSIEQKHSMNCVNSKEIKDYTRRIVEAMDADTLAALENALPAFAARIRAKIEDLLDAYREKQFQEKLDTGEIESRPNYALPKIITPAEMGGALAKSLYTSEAKMNVFEHELIASISALDNVKWWHKIAERKPYSFYLNGFINHYPDFLVLTENDKLLLIEAKGDDRDNSDSAAKLRLGRKWADKAGESFRYFMVYQTRNSDLDGTYPLAEFIGQMKKM
jgi:type III restriction enzyme